MSNKPATHHELVEPLQSFLETLTQELTEQKFVPAMRDELKRLFSALENLQQSEETLQQIARGVERLREVFAPAGTRLLEGARDLESLMRANADQLRERAGSVLNDLVATHEQLEGALRNEAGLLQGQTSASREALARTVADVEARMAGLSSQVDGLCRKLEVEVSSLAVAAPQSAGQAREMEPASPSAVREMELPSELRELMARSEQTIARELETYRGEISVALKQGRSEEQERLTRLDHRVAEALSSVGPRVQEELESAVTRLRDQLQTLILAEMETRTVRAGGVQSGPATPVADVAAALTASETRILREIASLQKTQKSDAGGERILKDLAVGFQEAAQRYSDQAASDVQLVQESMGTLQRLVTQLRDSERQARDELSLANASLDALVKTNRDLQHEVKDDFHSTLTRLDAQAKSMEQKAEEDRKFLGDLSASLSRAEQAATSAMELSLSDSRTQRDRIEAALKDLRERMERGQASDSERLQDTLRHVAEAWTEALETLRDFVQKTVTSRTDAVLSRLEGIESRMGDGGQVSTAAQRDLQGEIKRIGAALDERIQTLKGTAGASSVGMEQELSAVAGDIAALRARQEQSLAVLKEAIRANYDESAARLKEVIEGVSDSFIKQTAIVPQALDRYAHLIQSLHQGDQLALNGIASDTQNVLALAAEKFDLILGDSGAMKKFFPLLDKKLEKQATELEMVRKAQVRSEKTLEDLQFAVERNRETQENSSRDLKSEILRARGASDEGFESYRENLAQMQTNLRAVTDESLPAFRRELNALLASKLEFIENTLRDRQESMRTEIFEHLTTGRVAHMKTHWILAGLVGLSVLLQLIFHFAKTPGVGH